MQKNKQDLQNLLYFSGIPVVCACCGKQVEKQTYKKGEHGEYLCPECRKQKSNF